MWQCPSASEWKGVWRFMHWVLCVALGAIRPATVIGAACPGLDTSHTFDHPSLLHSIPCTGTLLTWPCKGTCTNWRCSRALAPRPPLPHQPSARRRHLPNQSLRQPLVSLHAPPTTTALRMPCALQPLAAARFGLCANRSARAAAPPGPLRRTIPASLCLRPRAGAWSGTVPGCQRLRSRQLRRRWLWNGPPA